MLTEILVSLFAIDSFRLWRRATAYPRLHKTEKSIEAPALLNDFHLISAPGVHVPEEVIWNGVQWADDEGVLVVDLLPCGVRCDRLLNLLSQAHPTDYAQRPFMSGVTAGFAVLVHESVLKLNPPPDLDQIDPAAQSRAWIEYARSLKRFAPWESALLLVKSWRMSSTDLAQLEGHGAQWREGMSALYGASYQQMKWATPIVLGLISWLCWSDLLWGGIALFTWMIQPILILHGQGFEAGERSFACGRPLWELMRWIKQLGSVSEQKTHEEEEALVKSYQEEISLGTERLFHARRATCPLCEGSKLTAHLTLSDQYQGKPGLFSLDRCDECDHIFQNPQLNLDGLSFYYRDFYDGLGEQGMDLVFGASEQSYRQRVAMIRAHGAPRRWLDVGGGHGHFALIAKHLLPQTQFDVLDLSESVDFAAQRRWCDVGIRGLFPEHARELAGRYDGISMSHYLEHTIDPLAELDAAAIVLGEGGMIMIEIPDPQSWLGKILRGFWLPWFQPQHLHFLHTQNLTRLLNERGFEICEVDRGEAHQSVDFFFFALIILQRIAPDPSRPWSPQRGAGAKSLLGIWRLIATLLLAPLILFAMIMDKMFRALLARPGLSNTLRILAIKEEQSSSA